MRLLELILALTVAACGIRLAGLGRAAGMQWIHGMQLLLAAVWVVQVLAEGWRWQMFPAYTAALIVAGTPSLLGLSAQTLFWSTTASVGLVAVSVMSCLLLPFVEPQPAHGAFAVGVTTIAVSVSRPPDAGAARASARSELNAAPLVRLWYPAEAPGGSPGFPTLLKQRIAARLRAIPTAPAAPDAPVARNPTKFPVIIYFDGWPEDKIQNIALILELASRGFAVAAVQYPVKLPGTSDASDARMRAQLAREMVEYSSAAAFERSVQLNHSRARAHARDAIAVLDALTAFDAQSGNPFAQRLDTQRAGTLGFSYGGAIAAEASRLDPRIKAAINMDGRHWGDALDQGVERPYLFICEELAMPTAADLSSDNPMIRYEAQLDQADYSQLAANLQARGGVRVTIAGMAHMNFTDFPLRSPLRRLSQGGTIDPRRAQEIIRTYVIEFFSRYLARAQPPALDSPWPQFPQVRVQSWPAPRAAR
jgi:dienelactone hydrolase